MTQALNRYVPIAGRVLLILCILLHLLLMVMPVFLHPEPAAFDAPISINHQWKILYDGEVEAENVSLPYDLGKKRPEFVDLYTTLPEKNFATEALSILVFQKNVWIYLDEVLLSEHVFIPSIWNKSSPGSGTVVATLPYDSAGKQLHIRYQAIIPSDSTALPPVSIINGALSARTKPVPSMVVLTLMNSLIFIGLLFLIICFLYRRLGVNLLPMLSLALILLSMASWTLCNSRMIELFTTNWTLIHNMEYLSLYSLPFAMWLYLKQSWKSTSSLPRLLTGIMGGFYVVILFARCFFAVDFFFFLRIFHLLVLINVPLFFIELVRNFKKQPESYRIFCFGIGILLLSAIIELVRFYTTMVVEGAATFFIWGAVSMATFLIISFIFSTKEKLDYSYGMETKRNLEAEHRRYEVIMRNTQDLFLDWNPKDDSVYFSERYEEFFGMPPSSKGFREILQEIVQKVHFNRDIFLMYHHLQNGAPSEQTIGSFLRNDGHTIWIDVELTTIFDQNGKPTRVIGIIKDITKSKQLEKENARQNQYLQINKELYDNVLEADITRDKLIGDNAEALAESLGLQNDLRYSDTISAITQQLTHDDFREAYMEIFSRERILSLFDSDVTSFVYECQERDENGEFRWIRLNVRIFLSDFTNTVHIISYVKNIDEEKKREFELLNNSQTDSLSRLLNKGAIRKNVDDFLAAFPNKEQLHAFLMIDVDKFKIVNDTFGHAIGDQVIADVSRKLREHFRCSDLIGRVGGDEFAVFLKETGTVAAVESKCRELCESFAYSFSQNDKSCALSVSIGVAMYPDQGTGYDELYKNADCALYDSKHNGRNMYSFYVPKES